MKSICEDQYYYDFIDGLRGVAIGLVLVNHWFYRGGFDSENLEADIERLETLGAKLVDGPRGDGPRICFLACPDNVRIELIQQ